MSDDTTTAKRGRKPETGLNPRFEAYAAYLKTAGHGDLDPMTLQIAQRNYPKFLKSEEYNEFRKQRGLGGINAEDRLAKIEERRKKREEKLRHLQQLQEKDAAREAELLAATGGTAAAASSNGDDPDTDDDDDDDEDDGQVTASKTREDDDTTDDDDDDAPF